MAGKSFYFLFVSRIYKYIYIVRENKRKCTVCPGPHRVGCFCLVGAYRGVACVWLCWRVGEVWRVACVAWRWRGCMCLWGCAGVHRRGWVSMGRAWACCLYADGRFVGKCVMSGGAPCAGGASFHAVRIVAVWRACGAWASCREGAPPPPWGHPRGGAAFLRFFFFYFFWGGGGLWERGGMAWGVLSAGGMRHEQDKNATLRNQVEWFLVFVWV